MLNPTTKRDNNYLRLINMGIFEAIRKSRAKTKAEIQAAKARAKHDAKQEAKLQLKQEKLLQKFEKDLLKEEKKGLKAKRKHERKMAENTLEQMKQGRLNAGTFKRYAGFARVALPVLLPVIYRAITAGREKLVDTRARRLGVSADQLAQFSGHGAEIKARIDGIQRSLDDDHLPKGFVQDVGDRLQELHSATDNAEFMTPEQRRRAHATISRDIDGVTQEIQDRLARG